MSLIEPCTCRLSREAAMTCPREARGRLIWSPVDHLNGTPVGEMRVADIHGTSHTLTFDSAWVHVSERLARDHARIRHLDFVAVDA